MRFTADGPGQTLVELEHRHLDRLAGGDAIRGAILSGGGWSAILELFAKAAVDQPESPTNRLGRIPSP